jgi:hypothetical protein
MTDSNKANWIIILINKKTQKKGIRGVKLSIYD